MSASRSRSLGAALMVAVVVVMAVGACASVHLGTFGARSRPKALVAEWIDVSHTTPDDSALWVLRGDGYDGSAHIRIRYDVVRGNRIRRTEFRYGTWYLDGAITDSTKRAICFARRLGRDGSTCLSFSLDTLRGDGGVRRRLTIRGYRGERGTGDRKLVERITGASR